MPRRAACELCPAHWEREEACIHRVRWETMLLSAVGVQEVLYWSLEVTVAEVKVSAFIFALCAVSTLRPVAAGEGVLILLTATWRYWGAAGPVLPWNQAPQPTSF